MDQPLQFVTLKEDILFLVLLLLPGVVGLKELSLPFVIIVFV